MDSPNDIISDIKEPVRTHMPSDTYVEIPKQSGSILFFKHIWLTIFKRAKLTSRNWVIIILEFLIPSALVVFVLGIYMILGAKDQLPLTMSPKLYSSDAPVDYFIAGNISDISLVSQKLS